MELFAKALDRILTSLAAPGRRIIILTSVPQWPGIDPLPCEVSGASLPRQVCPIDHRSIARTTFDQQVAASKVLFEVASRHNDVSVIDMGNRMCRGERCIANIDGEPLYRDASHLRRNLSDHAKQKLGEIIGVDEIFTQPSPQITQSR
jgi:hypothetical protein